HRGRHRQLRAHRRRVPRRTALRDAAARADRGQRQPARATRRRPGLLRSDMRNDTSTDAGSDDGTTVAEVAEGVRAAIATYTHALDDGRTDDVVATFTPDAVCDLGPMGRFEGQDALRAAYAGWAPRGPQRHLVLNTLVTAHGGDEADAGSDVV